MTKYIKQEGANECPLWYQDDLCPYLMSNGNCELVDPMLDCEDFSLYTDCEEDED